jgi:hypothetical protein
MSRRVRNSEGVAMGFSATMRPRHVQIPRRIDFYRLPRPVQERFAAATRRTAPPAPLLYQKAPRRVVWGLLGGSTLLAIVAVLLLKAGYGDVGSRLALHGAKMIVVDLLLWAATAYGVVHAMAILRAEEALPYKTGTYLFPGCIVEALGPVLRVWAVGEAESVGSVSSPSAGLALKMRDGSRVVVGARALEDAQRAERALGTVRAELTRALAEDDAHVLAEMDPLHDSAMSSPIGPTEPMKLAVSAWARFDWAVAAIVGVALGLVLVETRNSMSDEAMFRTVATQGTVQAYEEYLTQGRKHAEDVRDVLLPRVELAQAEAQGVDATEAFAQAHTGSKIQPEIDAALRRVYLAELAKAKVVGTVSALDDFTKKHPHSGLDPELAAARHALYGQALSAWKTKSKPDAATAAFMDRLFAWAEKSQSPAVEVRFRQRPSKTMDDADEKIKKNQRYPGVDALPSRYMKTDALRTREQRVAQDVVRGFASEIPADVISASAGAPLDGDAAPAANVPTLVVDYSPEWAPGSLNVCAKPLTVFAGLSFAFTATFSAPDGTPLVLKTKAWKTAELWKIKPEDMSRPDYEQKVYDSMIDGAFDQLDKRLTGSLF